MSKIVKSLIERGILCKVKKNKYMCTYKDWLLIIVGTDEEREFQLYFKSIHINTEYTFNEKFTYETIDFEELLDYIVY
jgi:hypothetical protein